MSRNSLNYFHSVYFTLFDNLYDRLQYGTIIFILYIIVEYSQAH